MSVWAEWAPRTDSARAGLPEEYLLQDYDYYHDGYDGVAEYGGGQPGDLAHARLSFLTAYFVSET